MRIAICDDNKEMLEYIRKCLYTSISEYTNDFKISCFRNGKDLLKAYNENEFDVVFLDIDMPSVTGFNVAKAVRDSLSKCWIVFITAYSELVYDCFEYQPFDFIRKDINGTLNKRLAQTVKRLMVQIKMFERIELQNSFSRHISVPINKIIYLESDKHYINYYVKGEKEVFRSRDTLRDKETKFKNYDFIRIHKSYLVNLRYVDVIDKSRDEVGLKDMKKRLPMSRNLKKDVVEEFRHYLRKNI